MLERAFAKVNLTLSVGEKRPDGYHGVELDVVALVLGVTHGEGLAGQHAVGHDGLEELLLAHGGQLDAEVTGLGAQLIHHLVAVDVVHLAAELPPRWPSITSPAPRPCCSPWATATTLRG